MSKVTSWEMGPNEEVLLRAIDFLEEKRIPMIVTDLVNVSKSALIDVNMSCEFCGKQATCVGCYDSDHYTPTCDTCCGHGNEDGHCVRCTDEDPCEACERHDGSTCEALKLLECQQG